VHWVFVHDLQSLKTSTTEVSSAAAEISSTAAKISTTIATKTSIPSEAAIPSKGTSKQQTACHSTKERHAHAHSTTSKAATASTVVRIARRRTVHDVRVLLDVSPTVSRSSVHTTATKHAATAAILPLALLKDLADSSLTPSLLLRSDPHINSLIV
jgi:hypothetical protein